MIPAVSIIVPVYNVDGQISRFLNSLIQQSFKDFEAIFIDDGSIDSSVEKIKAIKDERIKIITQSNKGVSVARNAGLEVAVGEFIMFADPDDCLSCCAVEFLYKKMMDTGADMARGVMESRKLDEISNSSDKLASKDSIGHLNRKLLWSFTLCNKIFKRSVIEKQNIRFKNIKYCEDGVFLFNYLRYANKIVGCNEVVYKYFVCNFWEEHSETQKMSYEYVSNSEIVLEKIKNYTDEYIKSYLYEVMEKYGKDSGYYNERVVASLNFQSELYRRMIQHNLLWRFYRNIWQLDDNTYELIHGYIKEWKQKVHPSDWKKLLLLMET